MAANDSHMDGQHQLTEIGVIGTLGTADVKGTALTLPIAVDPATGAQYVNNIGAPSGNPSAGTLNFIGTVGTLQLGTVVVNSIGTLGTLQLGTVTATVTTGTMNAGTINVGTVFNTQTVGTTNTGTVNTGTINTGTMNAGTINTGTINVGTFVMPSGTLNVGTVTATMTVGTVNAGTINTGTINVGTFVMPSGTLNVGTVTSNQASGTLNVGTVVNNGGTIQLGTFQTNPVPTIAINTFGTHGTTGVSIFGTLAGGTGSGAGTEIFITGLSLSMPSTAGSQDVSIGWGTNAGTFHAGTGLLVRGNFPAGGGIVRQFWPPANSGTNSQLCVFQAGAGTVDVSVSYFITPSTI